MRIQPPVTLEEAQRFFATSEPPPATRWEAPNAFSARAKEIASFVIDAIGSLADCVGASDLGKRCTVYAQALRADVAFLRWEHLFGSRLLAAMRNHHRTDTDALYLQTPPSSPLYHSPTFYFPQGLCRGICDWFSFLYLKRGCILSAARVFEAGAPPAAILLQAMPDGASWKALGLQVRTDVLRYAAGVSIKTLVEGINSLEPGCYALYVGTQLPLPHRMNYILTPNGVRYLVNPKRGCLIIENLEKILTLEEELISGGVAIDAIGVEKKIQLV